MRKAMILAAGVLLVGAAQAFSVGAGPTRQVTYGGALRAKTAGAWRAISDAGHVPVGIVSQGCDSSGFLVVSFPASHRVITANADADETLVARDIAVGVSVELDHLRIRFAHAGKAIRCADATLTGSTANIWVSVTMEPNE